MGDRSTGRLMEGMLAAFAQFDNDVRSDRTRAGMQAALELGRWTDAARLLERAEVLEPLDLSASGCDSGIVYRPLSDRCS
jgi:DNA invertase Pin-like site-specific DNA recombinase